MYGGIANYKENPNQLIDLWLGDSQFWIVETEKLSQFVVVIDHNIFIVRILDVSWVQ